MTLIVVLVLLGVSVVLVVAYAANGRFR